MQTFGVIGLGKFGYYVAVGLLDQGKKVIVADKNDARVREFSKKTDYAYILDSTNVESLKEAGFSNLDFVIVSIGEDIESSILTLMALKEIGVKNIITKAVTQIHGKILSKLGTSKVIHPERDAATLLLKSFIAHPEFEEINVSNMLKVMKVQVTKFHAGKSAKEILESLVSKKEDLDLIKIIAIKYKIEDDWQFQVEENQTLFEGAKIMFFGKSTQIDKIKL